MKAPVALISLFLAASCSTQTCWRGGIPMRDTELSSQQRASADILRTAHHVHIYRGLAHPHADPGRYQKQVAQGGWVEFHSFKFHNQPVDLPAGTSAKVLELYRDPSSHEALATKTTCAGFHPDYALVWNHGGRQRVLQICYGCHEWKYFGPGGVVHTDISEPAYFRNLLRLLPREKP